MEVRKHNVLLEGIGWVTVSTSDLDYRQQPETCLFWSDDSLVVEWYASWPDAIQGHVAWIAEVPRVARAIADYMKETR